VVAGSAPVAAGQGRGMLASGARGSVLVGSLLTRDEVSRALGRPVLGPRVTIVQPTQMAVFTDTGDETVLMLNLARGVTSRLALLAIRRGQPVPGIGDEAYLRDRAAAARRGDHVVTVSAMAPQDPAVLTLLLSLAAGRLPGA
jgi:hypothetical protein